MSWIPLKAILKQNQSAIPKSEWQLLAGSAGHSMVVNDRVWGSCRDPNGGLASQPKSRNRKLTDHGHYPIEALDSPPSQFASRSGG